MLQQHRAGPCLCRRILKDVINSTIYIPNVADAPTVMAYVGERFRGIDPARTVLCTPLGNDEFKVEIEVQAYKGLALSKRS